MNPRRLTFAALCAFFAFGEARAQDGGVASPSNSANQDFSLTVRQEPETAEFGKPFLLVVEVRHLPDLKLKFPKEMPEQENLRQVGPIQYERKDGAPTQELPTVQEIWRIPLLPLDLQDIDTPQLEVQTNIDEPLLIDPLAVVLKAVAPPPQEADDKGFEGHAGPFVFLVPDERPYALGIYGGVSLVCLLLFVWWLRRRQLPELPEALSPEAPSTPAVPPHVLALKRLDDLLEEGLLERGEVKHFVTILMNEILRTYLEGRYDFPAEKHTTRELIADLFRISDAGLDVKLVKDILETTDLVKFAKAEIPPQNAHAFANQVKALILNTKQDTVEEAA